MERSPWWHATVYTVCALMIVLVCFLDLTPVGRAGAIGSAVVIAVGWAVIGRHAWRSETAGIAYAVVVIAAAGVGAAFSPNFAFVQVIAFPLVWSLTPSFRSAIVANIALTTAVATGLIIANGATETAVATAIVTESASLTFSLAFGLWIGTIATRSEQRQRLLDELRATQEQLAAANRDIGITQERERLAREIHDTIAQDLTGLVMLTQRTRREVASGDPIGIDSALELLETSARSALAETRGLVAAGSPVGIANGGLEQALVRLADRFTRETDVAVAVDSQPTGPLGRDAEVVLLRVAQESLANVRKHAGAASATVRLERLPGALRLTVTDDGTGFDTDDATLGFGLSGMRERLALVNGSLSVHSRVDAGTTLEATLPLSPEVEGAAT